MKQTSSLLSRRHLLLAGTASLVIAACSGGSRKALAETGADGAAPSAATTVASSIAEGVPTLGAGAAAAGADAAVALPAPEADTSTGG